MNNKKSLVLLSVLSVAFLGATSIYAAGGRGPGGGQGGAGHGSTLNPNPGTPKKDGTGGPNKPANPDCPQDGSGAGQQKGQRGPRG